MTKLKSFFRNENWFPFAFLKTHKAQEKEEELINNVKPNPIQTRGNESSSLAF